MKKNSITPVSQLVTLMFYPLCATFILTACGENSKKEKVSFDQQTYSQFSSQVFSEKQERVSYIQNEKGLDSVTINKDNSVEVSLSFPIGYYRASVVNKLYKSITDLFSDATANATKNLSGADSKDTWDKLTNDAIKRAKEDMIEVRCSLDIKGVNLTPLSDPNVTQINDAGQIASLEFDVIETKGAPSVAGNTIPTAFHKSLCTNTNIKSILDDQKNKNDYFLTERTLKNWFYFTNGDDFTNASKAKITFNIMNDKELKYSTITFTRKND